MNQIEKLQKEAPQEIPQFVAAARLIKKIDGMFISQDQETYEQIKKTLSFTPSTKEGKQLKKNILAKAKKKSKEGILGGGVFLTY